MRDPKHAVTPEELLEETASTIDSELSEEDFRGPHQRHADANLIARQRRLMGGPLKILGSIIASSLLSCAVLASSAQAGTTLGARIGASIATASLDAQANFDPENRTGFTGTIFLDSGLGFFNLQPEVSYIQKGAKNATTGVEIALDYIEVAALLKVGLPIPVIQPHVFAGIGADFNTDTSITYENATLTTKNVDWTVPLGADIRLTFGKLGVYADARYAVGLTDISEGTAIFTDLKNRAWILSAGVGFEF